MKRHIVFLFLIFIIACKNNNNNNGGRLSTQMVNNPHTANGLDTVSAARKPTMDFADTTHDFGVINVDEVVSYEFKFTNNGKTPLLISGASGSCGCTVPVYPHDPIAPNGTGVLKVTFNSAGKKGIQNKMVTVNTNTLRSVHFLYIKSEIKEPGK